MKLFRLSFVAMAASTVFADFWLVFYRRHVQIGRIDLTKYGASFVDDIPEWTCETDAFKHRMFPDRKDVSGQNYGIQFDPWNSKPGPYWHDPLKELKLNIWPSTLGKQSISEDLDHAMIDTNGDKSGQCYLNRTFIIDLDCWFTHPDPTVIQYHVSINGSSMFFCESDIKVEEEADIWNALWNEGDGLPAPLHTLSAAAPTGDK